MSEFVGKSSIVRRIWGDADMVLLVFAGSAAEFALNRAVDWLFFTGKIPRDPIGRLFDTAGYAQHIVFADEATAVRTLDRINAVHRGVEVSRGQSIPDWAHRDVLYMLIDYSERAHELFERELTSAEREELYDVFRRVGVGLGIPELPASYAEWTGDRERHIRRDLVPSAGTKELCARYREHLGAWRYRLLTLIQGVIVPEDVRRMMGLRPSRWLRTMLRAYPLAVRLGLRTFVQRLLIPPAHLAAVRALDAQAAGGSMVSATSKTMNAGSTPATRNMRTPGGVPA